MSKTVSCIIIFISFSLLSGAAYFAYEVWKSTEETAYLSCIASVATKIQKSDEGKNLAEQNQDWKILNANETDLLMSKIQGGDCGKYPNQTLDIWNRKINIALRKPENNVNVMVWSNGRDGISGTEDDLVIPWGDKAPK